MARQVENTELVAMNDVLEILTEFPSRAQLRILRWVEDNLQESSPIPPAIDIGMGADRPS